MAKKIVNRGLLRFGQQSSQSTNYSVSRFIQTMSVDDGTTAFAAGHTALNSGGAVTNMYDKAFDAVPTESGTATITYLMTVPTASGNFAIKRIALHDDTAANVTTSSTSLVAGIDGQSLTKTSDFTLAITVTITFTDVS
jgi:hypothetical protein